MYESAISKLFAAQKLTFQKSFEKDSTAVFIFIQLMSEKLAWAQSQ